MIGAENAAKRLSAFNYRRHEQRNIIKELKALPARLVAVEKANIGKKVTKVNVSAVTDNSKQNKGDA